MVRPHRRPSGALAQADLDELNVDDLLGLLKADATREDLLGLWIGIDWAKNRKPGQEHAVEPHEADTLRDVPGLTVRSTDGSV